jgi:transmembrane sensor
MQKTGKITAFDTEQAWKKLHCRLENDGLLSETGHISFSRYPLNLKWAAAFLILIVTAGLVYIYSSGSNAVDYYLLTATEDATLVRTLQDGSVVYLASGSVLSLPEEFAKAERRVKVAGQAFFDVTHDPVKPFRIEAGEMLIEVLGTAFNIVSERKGHLELFVQQGKVSVAVGKAPGKTVIIEPGEFLVVDGNEYNLSQAPEFMLTFWRHDKIHFKDESLENILKIVNRNYNANILLFDQQIAKRQLTVTFSGNSLQTVVELICVSMNLNSEVMADSSIVLTPR